MALAVEVIKDGKTEQIEVGLDLTTPEAAAWVVSLCGADAYRRLVAEGWDSEAARAILYVNVCLTLYPESTFMAPPFPYDEFMVDWGELTSELDPDPDLEAAIAAASEVAG